jgi:hypothetical protein
MPTTRFRPAPLALTALLLALSSPPAAPAETLAPLAAAETLSAWVPCGGVWAVRDGVLTQSEPWVAEISHQQSGHIYLQQTVLRDFSASVEFRVDPRSPGVGGAELLFGATDSQTYDIVQFSTQASAVLLAKATAAAFWTDIARAPQVPLPRGEWQAVGVTVTGTEIVIAVNGKEVLRAHDPTLTAGRFGLGSSEARVDFRNLRVTGEPVPREPPFRDLGGRSVKPDFRVVCGDAGAGGYEAFPDVCRGANGDLLCVFYAGNSHISLPSAALPRGARIAAVRSRDEGLTWGPAQIVADTPWDDRDPSITCLRSGTLVCNWFTYYGDPPAPEPGKPIHFKELWLATSTDHGATWTEPRRVPVTPDEYWGATSPIVELSDGTLLWPVYRELQQPLRVWSALLRSGDQGQTWSGPHWVDEGNADNDEPAILELPDGRILCLMRNNAGDSMWESESHDHGLTWTTARKTGFPGHAPYLFRSTDGVLLVAHRLPATSLHWSLDDGLTWTGSLLLDACIGAYPSLVALRDGSVLCVYYEEGEGSSIRAQKLSVSRTGVRTLPWAAP